MKEKEVTVVAVHPFQKPRKIIIENELKNFQNFVGGLIECIPWKDAVLVCNEEGKLQGLPFNRPLIDKYGRVLDIIVGPFFLVQVDSEGNFCSLSEDKAAEFIEEFK